MRLQVHLKLLTIYFKILMKSRSRQVGLNESEQAFFDELARLKPKKSITNSEIVKKIKKYRSSKDKDILDELVYNFINLLMKKAWKYRKHDLDARDLIFYGIEGLVDSISYSFNLNSKNKFITYITYVIDRRMKDGVDLHRAVVKLPRHKLIEQRKAKFGQSKADQFLNPKIVTKINVKIYNDFEKVLQEVYLGRNGETIDTKLNKESLEYDISRIFNNILTKIEIEVLEYMYGLNGSIELVPFMIASRLGLSTSEVISIFESALEKIKANENAMNLLKNYLY